MSPAIIAIETVKVHDGNATEKRDKNAFLSLTELSVIDDCVSNIMIDRVCH